MKINFNKITQIIKKYKYIILLFIVIVVFLCTSSSIVEGFTDNIGEYDYLAPPPSTDNIDDETLKNLFSKLLDVQAEIAPPEFKNSAIENATKIKEKLLTADKNMLERMKKELEPLLKNSTKPEIEYFIKNGKFPLNGYVMNYLKNTIKPFTSLGQEVTVDDQMKRLKIYPNRLIYGLRIYRDESKQNPLPLSAKIYLGQEKPPSVSSTIITDDISAIKSNSNYSELVSLCKKVMRNR